MITMFLAYVLHRFLSGLRNGMCYREGNRSYPAIIWPVTGMAIVALIAVYQAFFLDRWIFLPPMIIKTCVCLVLFFLVATSAVPVLRTERKDRFPASDLHLWTTVEQILLSVLFCFLGWESLTASILAVYPAVLIQKITINLFSGLSWNYNGTDDPGGQTYGIPSLSIKVKRTSFAFRFLMALLSIILLTINIVYYESVRQMWEIVQRLFL